MLRGGGGGGMGEYGDNAHLTLFVEKSICEPVLSQYLFETDIAYSWSLAFLGFVVL